MSKQVDAVDQAWAGLRAARPRVLVRGEAFERAAEVVKTSPDAAAVWRDVQATAAAICDQPVSTHSIPDGKRLLEVSRRTVTRSQTLGLAYRLTGEARFRDRLWAEMEAVCGFPDWNPSHFLDTAEMAHAVAVAYDWLHDDWTDAQRCVMREGIVRHAFTPAMRAYDSPREHGWWVVAKNNWNIVCHGGLVTAAIALGHETPQMSVRVIREAVAHAPTCLRFFDPDGGWPEGPGYWSYTLRYLVAMLATMQAGLGTEFGLGDLPGLAATGRFPIHTRGPAGHQFNFADAGESRKPHRSGESTMIGMWLAQRYDDDELVGDADFAQADHPLALLWWRQPASRKWPQPDAHIRGVEVVTLRSRWEDPRAWYLAAQCGRNVVGHNQADLGSFVLDVLGQRWAVDLGTDDYNLPGYFGKQRWGYYRMRTEGHNAVVVNPDAGAGQDVDAGGEVTRFDAAAETPSAEMDLTPAYAGVASYVRRLSLPGRDAAVVEDVLQLTTPGEGWWFMHTRASVELSPDGRSATLTQGGQRLTATLESPADARFTVMPASPLPTSPDPQGQNPNDGSRLLNGGNARRVRVGDIPQWGDPNPAKAIRKLAVHLPAITDAAIRVRFTATP